MADDAVPNFEEAPVVFSWVPATPAKPNSRKQQLMYTNGQEQHCVQTSLSDTERDTPSNQATQANLFEMGILPGEVREGVHPETATACPSSSANLINVDRDSGNWQAGEAATSGVPVFNTWVPAEDANSRVKGCRLCTNDEFSLDIANNISCLDLLALAHSRKTKLGATNPEPDSTYRLRGPTSMTCRNSFDLHPSPSMATDAASAKVSPYLSGPITPGRNNNADHRHELTVKETSINESPGGEDAEGSEIRGEAVMELHVSGKSSQAVDQLYESTQLQENHNSDNGGTDKVNSIRTPQQKPRRKKHRPKVIIEAQQKRTPKNADKATVLQGPKSKKKYVRRKVLDDSFVGGNIQDDINEKASSSTSTPLQKRKYTRTDGMDTSEGRIEEGTIGTTDMVPPGRLTRSSCRRYLNFNLDDKAIHETSSYCSPSICDLELQAENFNIKDPLETLQSKKMKDVRMETNDTRSTSHKFGNLTNHILEEYPARHDQESSGPSSCRHLDPHNFKEQIVSAKGKCQVVFSNATHDKEEHSVQMKMNIAGHTAPETPTYSIFACLDREIQVTDLRMQYTGSERCNRDQIGAFYNLSQAYLHMLPQNEYTDYSPGLHFPQNCKRKRSEKVTSLETSSWQSTGSTVYNHMKLGRHSLIDSCTSLLISSLNQGPAGAQSEVTDVPRNQVDPAQNGKQIFEDLLALEPTEKIKRRRSKFSTRLRDSASLLEVCKQLPTPPDVGATIEILRASHTCREALVAGSHPVTKTKKRSNRSMNINSTEQNFYGHQNATTSMALGAGRPLALTWKHMSHVDSIIEQLDRLDLSGKNKHASVQKENTFPSYSAHYQEQQALVPFQGYGAVVPFDRSFESLRRKPRAKVDLDDETTRVWKLLLENINSEGIDGTDEAKAKWWEEERRVFKGRADSFIARMHLVQGDRRFSPWKGSVVDSVVGVFLTQNVSDHLSSSAFMSIAARFPMLNTSKIPTEELHEVGKDNKIEDPEVCVLDPDGTFRLNSEILDQPTHGEDAKIHPGFKIDSLTEVICGNSVNGYTKEDDLAGQSAETSKSGSQTSCEAGASKQIGMFEGILFSQTPEISSQNSANSPVAQATDRSSSCLVSTSEEEETGGLEQNIFGSSTSLVKLLQMAGNVLQGDYQTISDQNCQVSASEGHSSNPQEIDSIQRNKLLNNPRGEELSNAEISGLSSESSVHNTFFQTAKAVGSSVPKFSSSKMFSSNKDQIGIIHGVPKTQSQSLRDVTGSSSNMDSEQKVAYSNKRYDNYQHGQTVDGLQAKRKNGKWKENHVNWDDLRKKVLSEGRMRPKTDSKNDSVDWDAVRCADVHEIADTIKERGMNNILAQRIKDFLNRLVQDHESIDLEWLRDIPPDKAKEYLLSVRGLGLKSVECVRLLTLHQLAFPVDTNVGRIAVRLGWVPLQPLPESLQLHLLELYPVLESIQKYLWPRLCKLDQKTLYELHYQMITFGKVFCTKSKPNCNACPMRAECRHFASAFASSRLALPAPEGKREACATYDRMLDQRPKESANTFQFSLTKAHQLGHQLGASSSQPIIEVLPTLDPIIEMPATPEPANQVLEWDIEDFVGENPDEIPTIQLNMDEFSHNVQTILQRNTELQEADMSKALVVLTSEAASIPAPKLKNVSRLRTEHRVYELPDSHPLLEEMDNRESDDPSPYLLAIWTPGEIGSSVEPPQRRCGSEDSKELCWDESCSACNSIRETNSQTVRGTILIPCRTAMRGSFPLNGTYFQVNEVFSDHESSISPIAVPRKWLWNLPRRTVYFGTSIPNIFRGLTTEGIQYCFWRGFVCVRGFERKTRAPRPLLGRFHFPVSKLTKGKGKTDET